VLRELGTQATGKAGAAAPEDLISYSRELKDAALQARPSSHQASASMGGGSSGGADDDDVVRVSSVSAPLCSLVVIP
jgi:hypothetical protein